jgi:hypothetical protein
MGSSRSASSIMCSTIATLVRSPDLNLAAALWIVSG